MGFAVSGALTIRVVCVLSISAAFDGACQGERRAPEFATPSCLPQLSTEPDIDHGVRCRSSAPSSIPNIASSWRCS